MAMRKRKTRIDTIWDEVQAAIQAGYDPTWSYDSGLAAIKLGVSTKTLHRLRKIGAVRAFSIPSQFPGKVTWRYRQEDLDDCVLTHSNRKRYWILSKILNYRPRSSHYCWA